MSSAVVTGITGLVLLHVAICKGWFGENKKKFFDALPNKFQRKEAIEIGKKFDIGERSVGNFLKSCLGKYLEQPEYGFYRKFN